MANVNLDGLAILYPFRQMVALGAEHSTLDSTVARVARRLGVTLAPDPFPQEVFFVRSDQYSFVRRGVIPRADPDCEHWRRAIAIARIAESRATRLLPENVLWYHANYVSPSWGRRLERNRQIGAHIFYS